MYVCLKNHFYASTLMLHMSLMVMFISWKQQLDGSYFLIQSASMYLLVVKFRSSMFTIIMEMYILLPVILYLCVCSHFLLFFWFGMFLPVM